MRCDWNGLLSILPGWMRRDVDEQGRDTLQELRLRIGLPPELVRWGGDTTLQGTVTGEDLTYIVNVASQYSPWAAATMAQGYISAPGGHRIGSCGEAIIHNGRMTGLRKLTSLCIRIARDLPGIAGRLEGIGESVLIIGKPGSGKTTLLRDLIRQRAKTRHVAVVDERGELFPEGFDTGPKTDILTGCQKGAGVGQLLRTMSPSAIAVDEITAAEDCDALIDASWCGVALLATAHAASKEDLYAREVYRPLVKDRIFDTLVILRSDKSWELERM